MKRINDIIGYEKAVVTDSSFYKNIAVCSQFDDTKEGYADTRADSRFAQTSEDLAIFFSDLKYLGKYSVERIYYTEASVTPRFWAYDFFGGGPAGNANEPIPAYLEKPGFAWDGNADDVSRAVNNGKFLVTHRDHGGASRLSSNGLATLSGWGAPSYHSNNVQTLQNGNKLPVVWSINCETGWFDNETDEASISTPYDAVNFSEAWERNPNGGAVGIIAATRISNSTYNDLLAWGWTDAIWPSFEASSKESDDENPIYEMGQVLNYGKMYMLNKLSSSDSYVKQSFELFHWFGDPTMEIRTDVPQNFNVSHPSSLPEQAKSIDVTVDQADALICVSKDGEILTRGLSATGAVRLSWSEPLVQGDEVNIVVTKHNYRPYEGSATVGETGTGVISGMISDSRQYPLSGAKIKIPLVDESKDPPVDESVEVFSDQAGNYRLFVSNELLPPSFAVLASKEGFIPASQNVTKSESGSYTVNFVMQDIPQNMVILEIEPAVHHLGNDEYGGAANSQFQQKTEGTTYVRDFEVSDFQLSFPQVEISLFAKGAENNNRLFINGTQIGVLDSSPKDGSFASVTLTFSSLLLKGTDTLTIQANYGSGDYDDFEFTNIVMRFKNKYRI